MTSRRTATVSLRTTATLLAAVAAAGCTAGADRVVRPPARLKFAVTRSVLQDRSGNYWFGSWNEGVCRFDGETFTYFTVADGLTGNQVRAIQEDRNGVVWFECDAGICGFDGQRIVTPSRRDHAAKHDWRIAAGDLWFMANGAVGATEVEALPGCYRYDGEVFTFLAYPVRAMPDQYPNFATTGIARGRDGRVWCATYDAVFGYDGRSFTTLDDRSLGLGGDSGRLHVRCVLEDSKGRLWIGNNGIGVLLYDGQSVRGFTQEMGLGRAGRHGDRNVPLPGDAAPGAPSMHRVFSLGEDRAGNIWFGTIEHGVWRYDGTSMRNFTGADGMTSADVFAIYTDRHGDLWVAGNGVFRFDGTRFERVF
ncbi:MAG: hypothetical protein JNL08_10495 [Planctomycetes bacterium]|nr:hypothetical protein [Planctomycetota bacterium]